MSAQTPMVGIQPGPIVSGHSGSSMSMQDPNSVHFFKQNIQMVLESVLSMQNVARNALSGIQNAYHPGSSPAQTEANLQALRHNIELLSDMSVHTGVGALPLLPFPPVPASTDPASAASGESVAGNAVPSEAQMINDASRSIQVLFERLKRVQESAGTVANLLQAP